MFDAIINLFTGGGSAIVKAVGDIIDKTNTSDEEKAEAKLRMQQAVTERLALMQQGAITEMNAKRDVTVAELNQGDNYTKRARPTVVYAGLVMMFVNEVLLPWLLVLIIAKQGQVDPVLAEIMSNPPQLSVPFYTAWGGITGSWAIGRSVEKVKGQSKMASLMQAPAELFQRGR